MCSYYCWRGRSLLSAVRAVTMATDQRRRQPMTRSEISGIHGTGTALPTFGCQQEMILMMVWALHDRLAHAIKEEMRMAQSIRDVMSANPITMPVASTVSEAARTMREANIGDIIVLEGDQLYGIVTDRDIVVRTIAEGRDPETATLGDICSREMTTLSPTDKVEDAVLLMRDKAIRRVPVIENGTPIGIVSLGDLAVSQDLHSTLGHISAAPPNV